MADIWPELRSNGQRRWGWSMSLRPTVLGQFRFITCFASKVVFILLDAVISHVLETASAECRVVLLHFD